MKPRDSNEDHHINLVDVLKYLFTFRWFIGLTTIVVPTFIGLWTFFVATPKYNAQVLISIAPTNATEAIVQTTMPSIAQKQVVENKLFHVHRFFKSARYKQSLIAEIKGETNFIEKYGVNPQHREILQRDYVTDTQLKWSTLAPRVEKNINILADGKHHSLVLLAKGKSPEDAAALADVAAIVLVELNYQSLVKQIRGVKIFLKNQTANSKDQLRKFESQIVELQKSHKIFSTVSTSRSANDFQVKQVEKRHELKRKMIAHTMLIGELEAELKSARENLSQGNQPSQLFISQAQKRLELLKYEKALNSGDKSGSDLNSSISEAINDFRQAFDRVKANETLTIAPWQVVQDLEEYLLKERRKLAAIKSELSAHNTAMNSNERKFDTLPAALQKLASLRSNLKLTSELYSQLKSRLQDVEIREAARANDLNVVAAAELPAAPTGMGVLKRYLMAIFGGFVIGICLLFLRYLLTPIVRNQDELSREGLKVLGDLPMCQNYATGLLPSIAPPHLVVADRPTSFDANAVRRVRFKFEKILKIDSTETSLEGKVVTVTSVNPNEGKTFTVANLGYALSLSGFKVLMIDLDMEKPELRTYYQISNQKVLNGDLNSDFMEFIQYTAANNLTIMEGHKKVPNICDYLDGAEFKNFVDKCRKNYDIILIDTPPLSGFLEPMLATQKSDAVLFVVDQRHTLKDSLISNYHSVLENFEGQHLVVINFAFDDLSLQRRQAKRAA